MSPTLLNARFPNTFVFFPIYFVSDVVLTSILPRQQESSFDRHRPFSQSTGVDHLNILPSTHFYILPSVFPWANQICQRMESFRVSHQLEQHGEISFASVSPYFSCTMFFYCCKTDKHVFGRNNFGERFPLKIMKIIKIVYL